jgi:hypothetical protein
MNSLESKTMKVLGGFLLLLFAGCINSSTEVFNYTTTVTVTDMNGQPLAGQKVKLAYGFSISSFNTKMHHTNDSAFTDNTGKVKFNYALTSSESHADNALFGTTDDNTWIGVESVSQSITELSKSKKLNELAFSIRKDSLMPILIRLQKTSNTLGGRGVGVSSERISGGNAQTYSTIDYRQLFSWSRDSIALFDTTFTLHVYSKISGIAGTSTFLKQNSITYLIPDKTFNFKPSDYKDKPLLIQLQ